MNPVTAAVQDVSLCVKIAGAALAGRLLPERAWMPLARVIGRLEVLAGPATAALPYDDVLAASLGLTARSIAADRIAAGHAARVWGLSAPRRPPRARRVELRGTAHVEHALAQGKGAILWVGCFAWASIITKTGMHDAGFPVTHLSRPSHGFAASAFAVRRLNPIWTRVEERFLRRRLVMKPGSETTALRALRRCLDANELVSITVGGQGVRSVTVPFLGGDVRLATGPLSLAAAAESPILPAFSVREDDGTLLVEIEGPLDAAPDLDRGEREARMAEAYTRRLEPWVRRHPGQWLG